MSEFSPPLIVRHSFDVSSLMAEHPPKWQHPNKTVVFREAMQGPAPAGEIVLSRWQAPPLPSRLRVHGPTVVEPRQDVFGYEPSPAGVVEWYLNFAHWDLFCSYGFGLLAQDEMQVAEHPVLGSLREALLVSDIKPFTVDMNEPTPILIRGAERRIALATDRNRAEGRPDGLYGNCFMRADADSVVRACRRLNPPTITNLIAMEAPTGSGVYTHADITFILRSALTGFAAARMESTGAAVIHTGFWGCGAYGGNRILMGVLQILAARAAGIARLVFHTFDAAGSEALREASEVFNREVEPLGPDAAGDLLVMAIQSQRFEWGVSDGN